MPSPLIHMTRHRPEDRILGFSGSPRRNGNSDALLKQILAGAGDAAVPTDGHNLSEISFQGCIGCEQCRKTKVCTRLMDGMSLLYPEIYASRGIVLVSPSHNYNVTSWMKAFIDRLYCFYNFENDRPRSWSSQLSGQGRKAVIAGICEQESAADMGFTVEAMKKPLEALGYEIVAELSVLRVFDKGKVKEDEEVMEQAFQAGRSLARSLKVPS